MSLAERDRKLRHPKKGLDRRKTVKHRDDKRQASKDILAYKSR